MEENKTASRCIVCGGHAHRKFVGFFAPRGGTLATVDFIAAEDTRVTMKLFKPLRH